MSSLHNRQSSVLSKYSSYLSLLSFITVPTSSLLIILLLLLNFLFFPSHSFISFTLDVFSPILLYNPFSVIPPFSYLAFLISSSWLKQFAYSTSLPPLITSTFPCFIHLHFFSFPLLSIFPFSLRSLSFSPHLMFLSFPPFMFSFFPLFSPLPHLLTFFFLLSSLSLFQYLILTFPPLLFSPLPFTFLLYNHVNPFLFTHLFSPFFSLSVSPILTTNPFNHLIFSSSLPSVFFLYTKILFHLITSVVLFSSLLSSLFLPPFHIIVTSFVTSPVPSSHSLILLPSLSLPHFTPITHSLSPLSSLLTILPILIYGFFTLIGASRCVCLSARYDLIQNSTALFPCFIVLSVAPAIHGFILALFRKDKIIHLHDLSDINDPTLHIWFKNRNSSLYPWYRRGILLSPRKCIGKKVILLAENRLKKCISTLTWLTFTLRNSGHQWYSLATVINTADIDST